MLEIFMEYDSKVLPNLRQLITSLKDSVHIISIKRIKRNNLGNSFILDNLREILDSLNIQNYELFESTELFYIGFLNKTDAILFKLKMM